MILTVTLNPSIDHYVSANNFRLGQLNRVMDRDKEPGGKGINVGRILCMLGADVMATGFLNRHSSRFVQERLHKCNLKTNFVHIEDQTRHNFFIVDDANNSRTLIDQPGPEVDEKEMEQFKELFSMLAPKAEMIVLSGSLPVNLPDDTYCELIDIANRAGVKTILNTEEKNMAACFEKGPYIVMPDTRAVSTILGEKIEEKMNKKQIACRILSRGSSIAIFMYDFNHYIFSTKDGCWEARIQNIDVQTVFGAQDGMIAGMVYALTKDPGDIRGAIIWGTAVSTAVSTFKHGLLSSKEDVEKYLDKVVITEI